MRSESAYLRRFKNPYRPAYEIIASGLWAVLLVYVLWLGYENIMPQSYIVVLLVVILGMSVLRLTEGWIILRHRSLLCGYRVSFMSFRQLLEKTKADELWTGFGFLWTFTHAQKLYDLSKVDHERLRLNPMLQKLLGRHDQLQPDSEIGCKYLHGLETREIDICQKLKTFEGGTLLIGTTQAGKGVMLGVLVSQAIFQGRCVIVIDPKSSSRLLNNMKEACRIAGRRPPLTFHPAHADEGVIIDPLQCFNNPTEVASRVVAMLPPDMDGAFAAFAWGAVNTIVCAMIELGEQPTLLSLGQHIDKGIEPLLQRLLDLHIQKNADESWKSAARAFMPRRSDNTTDEEDALALKISWYDNVMEACHRNRVIDQAMKVHFHSREHYGKITASLMPILSMMTTGSLEKMLSPNPNDPKDKRTITDLSSVIENNQVLYVGLDSLANPTVATALGALLMADLASVAGMRYNLRKNDRQIALFVDEASNVINQPLIEILNKGAEGGIQSTCAMQTIADLANRLKSEHAARMALGNFNNLIAMRSKDRPTQDFITETFGKAYISQVDTTLATHASTAPSAPAFYSGASHRKSASLEEIVPAEYLGRLPNCQFFASLGGGKIYKGRVPILFDDEAQQEKKA